MKSEYQAVCEQCWKPVSDQDKVCPRCGRKLLPPGGLPKWVKVAVVVWLSVSAILGIMAAVVRRPPAENHLSQPPANQAVAFSVSPFDPSVRKLAPSFAGNDIEAIHRKLTETWASERKGEFEMNQEFRTRMEREKDLPLIASLTRRSTLAFVIPLESYDTSYDADGQVLRLKMNVTNVTDVIDAKMFSAIEVKSTVDSAARGVGENAFGMKMAIDIKSETYYSLAFLKSGPRTARRTETGDFVASIRLGRDEASKIKDKVRGLVICELVPPFSSSDYESREARIDYPYEFHLTKNYVHVSVLGVWFFDSGSGRILAKLA